MLNIKRIILVNILLLLITPLMSFAQTRDGIHERGMMRNRTNVQTEGSDYTIGIVKDTTRLRNSLIRFISNSPTDDDAAAESEDDILLQTSSNSIHRVKKDFSNLTEPIALDLIDEKGKRYFSFPLENYRVTSNFGPRRRRYHYGIDLGLRTGEPIKAMFDGRVRVARRAGAYGNLVVIEHHNQLETYYAHLSKIDVEENQMIKAGEVLGLGGNTGRSTGPHLHLEIRYEGAAINPTDVLDFTKSTLIAERLELTRDNFRHQSTRNSNARLANNKTTTGKNGGKYVTVRRGETLSSIARRNNTSVKQLARLNNIKGSKIKAGQKLRVR